MREKRADVFTTSINYIVLTTDAEELGSKVVQIIT